MAVVDIHTNKAVIEFRNTYSVQNDKTLCRYCSNNATSEGVCSNEECTEKYNKTCKRILECGHQCNGNVDEETCLPCLRNCSETLRQDADDMCVICFTESLAAAPSSKLVTCGHIHHTACLVNVTSAGW